MAAAAAVLIQTDAAARQLLDDSVSGIADAFAAEIDQLLETTEGA